MPLSQEKQLEYLYQEYKRLSDKALELFQDIYTDIKLFGAIGVSAIFWKPISDFIASSYGQINAALVLFLGFLGVETLLGVIGLFSLIKQANIWYFTHQLQVYESKLKNLLSISESDHPSVFHFYYGLGESRYINGIYRTGFAFFALYIKVAVTIFPFVVLCLTDLKYAVIFLFLSMVNTILLLMVSKRVFRYYPGRNLVSLKYFFTHILRPGPMD
jgi:hypothetical protein